VVGRRQLRVSGCGLLSEEAIVSSFGSAGQIGISCAVSLVLNEATLTSSLEEVGELCVLFVVLTEKA
jgi:hypothetical protein